MLPTRKVSDSIANPVFFTDPSRMISEELGKEFLHDIGALRIHRIGLMNGIGFSIPYGEARDHINLVQIVAQYVKRVGNTRDWEGLCTVRFCKCTLHEDHLVPPDIEVIRTVSDVPINQLVDVYRRGT